MKKQLLIIFIIALILRTIIYTSLKSSGDNPEFLFFDSIEYYTVSQNLTVPSFITNHLGASGHILGYTHWYERTPAYMLFLHIVTVNNAIWLQILLSSIGVVLMYKMNSIAGYIWCVYPVSVFNSFQFMKETLLIFLIILAVFYLRDKKMILYFVILGIMLMFASYGKTFQFHPKQGFMQNFYEMWKPSFNMIPLFLSYILFLPYILFMFYFVRHVDVRSFEMMIVITFTLVYSLVYGQNRFREPLMPILILWFADRIKYVPEET